jgi:hypothetical protein
MGINARVISYIPDIGKKVWLAGLQWIYLCITEGVHCTLYMPRSNSVSP